MLKGIHFIKTVLITYPRWVLDPSLSAWDSSTRGTYNYKKSDTAYLTNEAFSITYGGGLVTGRQIIETIAVGGLTFKNAPMGIGNTTSPNFIGQPFIGILGLGPQPIHSMMLPLTPNCPRNSTTDFHANDLALTICFLPPSLRTARAIPCFRNVKLRPGLQNRRLGLRGQYRVWRRQSQ